MNPYFLFGLISLFGAVLVTALLSQIIQPVAAWLVAINLSALIIYRADKLLAQANRLRVPEILLLGLEAVGGTIGAGFAMWGIYPRHKTQSTGFLLWFIGILVLQILLLVFFAYVASWR